jgi:hypothetical protein
VFAANLSSFEWDEAELPNSLQCSQFGILLSYFARVMIGPPVCAVAKHAVRLSQLSARICVHNPGHPFLHASLAVRNW